MASVGVKKNRRSTLATRPLYYESRTPTVEVPVWGTAWGKHTNAGPLGRYGRLGSHRDVGTLFPSCHVLLSLLAAFPRMSCDHLRVRPSSAEAPLSSPLSSLLLSPFISLYDMMQYDMTTHDMTQDDRTDIVREEKT